MSSREFALGAGAQLAQDDVPPRGVGIVEAFEVIDVQQMGRGACSSERHGEFAFERLLHEPAVEESGKGIGTEKRAEFAKLEVGGPDDLLATAVASWRLESGRG